MRRSVRIFAVGLAAGLVAFSAARAAEIEVKMENSGPDNTHNVFEPAMIKIQPGDTVVFKAVDKAHNVQSIDDMLPKGAQPFKGALGQDYKVTLTQPGLYGVKCLPHYFVGMVALIEVGGNTSNLADLKTANAKNPPPAQKKFDALFAQLGS